MRLFQKYSTVHVQNNKWLNLTIPVNYDETELHNDQRERQLGYR